MKRESKVATAWRLMGLTAALTMAPMAASHAAAVGCGDLRNAFGPLDYRTASQSDRTLVEGHHFTPKVEALKSGQEAFLANDLDYTLRAFPNHPRALLAMVKYGEREKTEKFPSIGYSVECYIDRGIRMASNDPMPHLIYAIYLRSHKRFPEMREQLDEAERLQGDSPTSFDIDYNAGLLYFDLKDYDKSVAAAQRAYAMGAPFPGLQNKLKSVGKWPDK
jgi:tetratricopeptide (TPR) repeat protein